MSCLNRLKPGTLFLMVGLLPLAASQVQAQSTTAASLLGGTVIALPSDTMNTDSDSNTDPLGDLNLGDADLLGTQDIAPISHAGSGLSSGWLLGGALGAAAGVAGLASGGGGSSAASLLRTPASPVGPTYATEIGATSTVGGNIVTVSNNTTPLPGGGVTAGSGSKSGTGSGNGNTVGSGSSSAGSGGGISSGNSSPLGDLGGGGITAGGGISGGGENPLATPEPGTMALFGGMGLMLTAVKLRRRKR